MDAGINASFPCAVEQLKPTIRILSFVFIHDRASSIFITQALSVPDSDLGVAYALPCLRL